MIGVLQCVEDVSNQKSRITEVDVSIHIMDKLRLYTKVPPDKALRPTQDTNVEKYGILVEDLSGYIKEPESDMEFFELRRDYNHKKKTFFIRRIYNCFR